jgi:hypothetical protein
MPKALLPFAGSNALHLLGFWLGGLLSIVATNSHAALRTESFDHAPARWEGVNHRNTNFPARTVTQDFGFSPGTRHAGGEPGEAGGRLQPSGEAAYFAWRLPEPLSLDNPMVAEGRLTVPAGPGHFMLGFFNARTLNEWRTPNSLVLRLNARGETFHCHFEYTTARWRAGAGVIGHIIPGERVTARELPAGVPAPWRLAYDPNGAGGRGVITSTFQGVTARCELDPGHRADGARFTHFGLLSIPKTWDSAGEGWIDDVVVNGARYDFSQDPGWEGHGNRRTYLTTDTRPRFDFGWSPTRWAGGAAAGELGGLIFRGDCREPSRMACYGDPIGELTLDAPLEASGTLSMRRGVTDSTASIGFYHAVHSMRSNPSQKHSIPMDYMGINIEGPSSEGFYFYPVYRAHGDGAKALSAREGRAPRIHPDGSVHTWRLHYDPAGANGRGRITVSLDDQTCVLDLEEEHRAMGASFNRFGICTPWIDGNSVTVFFDDLTYTSGPGD